jgi:hypothetical protein
VLAKVSAATTLPANYTWESELARARAQLAQKSDAARCDVAIDIVPSAEEDDPVTCRIGLVIFQLVVRNDDLCSDVDMLAT